MAIEEGLEKFASIEAISGDNASSSNPWVEAHKSLNLIQDSSRKLIKAEEKRNKKLREAWKNEMDVKANLYPEMARDQQWWRNMSNIGMFASMTAPFIATGAGQKITEAIHRIPIFQDFFRKIQVETVTGALQRVPDLVSNLGNQAIQIGSQMSSLEKKDRETLSEWSATQERQNLEQQQQLVQEARQADTSLKERHLEVIKTLTAQVTGR